MSNLYLFNPENDINLGYGHDTPRLSPMVKALISDGQMLPLWYAQPGDYLLADKFDHNWAKQIADEFDINVKQFTSGTDATPMPWGWSIQTARRFKALGLTTPLDSNLEKICAISHRRSSIFLAERLGYEPAIEVHSIAEINDYLAKNREAYIKAPWSSSGRGVFHTKSLSDKDCGTIASIIKRQGSVMIERAYNRRQDFAMLFYAESDGVKMKGYSLFLTASDGSYLGNFIGSDTEIIYRLKGLGVDENKLHEISNRLESALTELIDNAYTGWLGVDMMVTDNGEIVPCVELNLRMTMGVVAWIFSNRWLSPGRTGYFSVSPIPSLSINDYSVVNGLLDGGRLRLTPLTDASRFEFTVTVER